MSCILILSFMNFLNYIPQFQCEKYDVEFPPISRDSASLCDIEYR